MLLLKNFHMRWIHWPVLLSVCLHVSIAAALWLGVKPEKAAEAPPMSVAMIQLAAAETPAAEVVKSESIPETEPVPEPIAKLALPKPKPEKKPIEKKPKEKKIVKKNLEPKEVKTQKPAEEPVKSEMDQGSLLAKKPNEQKSTDSNTSDTAASQEGPKILSRVYPTYPPRAQALGIEGYVRVKFDIDENGRVRNIEVLSANPKNFFVRDVKDALKKWRYEKKPGIGYITTVEFKLEGVSMS
ncbi:MAG: TonB system transport protein TonB [Enterobacteriaceae bacterium]|jgi:protein TonB|nr:TonB system transport protein TonB [Enterobacteriaceae bacterium]